MIMITELALLRVRIDLLPIAKWPLLLFSQLTVKIKLSGG